MVRATAFVLLLPGVVSAQERVLPSQCYDLALGEWQPALDLGADTIELGLPNRVLFDSIPGARLGPELRVMHVAPNAMPSIHEQTGWTLARGDTLRLLWSSGFSGVYAELLSSLNGFRGTARSFWDFDRVEQQATIELVPTSCDAPLAVSAADQRFVPNSLTTESGLVLELGADFQQFEALEREESRMSRWIDGDGIRGIGATLRIRVSPDNEGHRLRNVRATFGTNPTWEELRERLIEMAGAPSHSYSDERNGLASETLMWSNRERSLSLSRSENPDGSWFTSLFLYAYR